MAAPLGRHASLPPKDPPGSGRFAPPVRPGASTKASAQVAARAQARIPWVAVSSEVSSAWLGWGLTSCAGSKNRCPAGLKRHPAGSGRGPLSRGRPRSDQAELLLPCSLVPLLPATRLPRRFPMLANDLHGACDLMSLGLGPAPPLEDVNSRLFAPPLRSAVRSPIPAPGLIALPVPRERQLPQS